MYTVAQVAERLQLSTRSVYDLVRSGKLEHFVVTGRQAIRVSEAQLNEYLASVKRGGQVEQAKPKPEKFKLKYL